MSRAITRLAVLGGAASLVGGAIAAPALASQHSKNDRDDSKHVLLISVDGLHQSDLAWYVKTHPTSALAKLVAGGVDYAKASTPVPSDSFPGMVAQVTGGNPGTTGVYYDDTFNHAVLPAGTKGCVPGQKATGGEVYYAEPAAKDMTKLDSGAGLSGLPGSILSLTGNATSLIDPANLPIDPTTCKPIYPHSYLQVNTVFEVAKAAGLHTAWSDKHAAYDILNGPSGQGIDDLFTPEINSDAPDSFLPAGGDWTTNNKATQQYDGYKVAAVLNEIDGKDHSGTKKAGVPAIFGLNFQSVSTAEKLPTSGGLAGGYLADGVTPGPLLTDALNAVDAQVGRLTGELKKKHLTDSTTVVLSAKHGQSPMDPNALTRIDDGKLIDGLNAAWKAAHPDAALPLVAQTTDDDAVMMWLNDRSQAAADFAKKYLLAQSGTGNDVNGRPKAFTASGLDKVYAGEDAAEYFHTKVGDPRVPDLYGVVKHGVVYTGKQGKIAEHGGADANDTNVPIVVSGAGVEGRGVVADKVETTQIAPTILKLLGLDPKKLQAVKIEGTRVLPDLKG